MNLSERIRYADLVDVSKLQVLMESFHQVLGIANAVIDVDGQVLDQVGWQEACANFHRVNPESRQHCVEGDTALVKNMTCGRRHAVYKCLNGLVDTASPTMVAGQHMANVFSGQFLQRRPILNSFDSRQDISVLMRLNK